MSKNTAQAICAFVALAAVISSTAYSQASDPPAPSADTAAPAAEPSLTPLETIQYINQKIVDQSRIPSGMDTGAATMWPGYFAIEQSTGTLWWVRGAQTSPSQWEIRYSSVQVDQLDPNLLELGVGHGDYEKITLKCKASADAGSANPCWHNWVASWDDQSSVLSAGHFGDLTVARVADHADEQILNGYDVSVSPLKKQILLFDGKQKQLIDVEPTNPFPELEVYLGAADSETAQRIERAIRYLLKTMPAAVTAKDPFGP